MTCFGLTKEFQEKYIEELKQEIKLHLNEVRKWKLLEDYYRRKSKTVKSPKAQEHYRKSADEKKRMINAAVELAENAARRLEDARKILKEIMS